MEEMEINEDKNLSEKFKFAVIQGPGDNNQKVVKVFTSRAAAIKAKNKWNDENGDSVKKNKKGKPIPAHLARVFQTPLSVEYKSGQKVNWSDFSRALVKEEIEMNESEFKTVRGKDGKKYDVKISMDGKKFKFRVTDKTGNVGAFKVISLGQAAKLFENLEELVDITEESGIELARKIVDRKQHMKGIDLTTAGLILQVYDKVNDKNKAKMDKMSAKQLASVVYKLLSKEEFQEEHDMYGYKLFEEELDEAHCSSKKMKKEGITDEDVAQFIGAASAAKKAGKKNFSFGGKTYPVTISGDTAKKVLEDSLKEEECDHCDGSGKHGKKDCPECGGDGEVSESKYTDIEELIESSDKKDAAEMSKLVKELQPKISKSELKKEVHAMAMEKYKNKARAKKIASFA